MVLKVCFSNDCINALISDPEMWAVEGYGYKSPRGPRVISMIKESVVQNMEKTVMHMAEDNKRSSYR
ncbi:hypothetical protein BH11PAT1_BH11PAT1_5550 [soil metagenome]